MTVSGKKILCYDLALFPWLAQMFAREGAKVWYFTPGAESAFKKSQPMKIGSGIKGVTRVPSIWGEMEGGVTVEDMDAVIFPDSGSGPLQVTLREMGLNVWGSGMTEDLEFCRGEAKQYMKKLGIGLGDYELAEGVDQLKRAVTRMLKDHSRVWVKTDFRGDAESFDLESPEEIEYRLEKMSFELGPLKHTAKFVIEGHLDGVEIAYDSITVDGQYPSVVHFGIEQKGLAYVGAVCDYDEMPEQILRVNEQLAPTYKENQCRSIAAVEMLVGKDGKENVTDPAPRFTSPCSESCSLLYENWCEAMLDAASGKVPKLRPIAPFVAQLQIHSRWAKDGNWLHVHFDPKMKKREIEESVRLRNFLISDGEFWTVPGEETVGSVCAVGDTMEEAAEECKRLAKMVKGEGAVVEAEALDRAMKSWSELGKYGVKVPE